MSDDELDALQVQQMLTIARRVVSKYKALTPNFEREEMEQAALVEMVDAYHNSYDPFFETPFGAFCHKVAVSSVNNALIRARSPVSSSDRASNLKGLFKLSLSEPAHDESKETLKAETYPQCQVHHNALRELEHEEFRLAVRERLRSILGELSVDFVVGILAEQYTPKEIAEDNGLSTSKVVSLREQARAIIAADPVLKALWKEPR